MGKSFLISFIIFCHNITRTMGKGKAVGIIYLYFNNAFNMAGR